MPFRESLAGSLFIFLLLFSFSSQAAEMRIVALGDSTTSGTPGFQSPLESPPDGQGNPESQYTHWIMKIEPEWQILNRGVRGERTDQILKRLDRDALSIRPDAVILLAGVNDLYQGAPSEWVEQNLQSMYERIRATGIPVLACTILPYNNATPDVRRRMEEVNRWIEHYSRERQMGYCDTFTALQHPDKPGSLLGTPDGLHPDRETYRRMGETIHTCLKSYLSLSEDPADSR